MTIICDSAEGTHNANISEHLLLLTLGFIFWRLKAKQTPPPQSPRMRLSSKGLGWVWRAQWLGVRKPLRHLGGCSGELTGLEKQTQPRGPSFE